MNNDSARLPGCRAAAALSTLGWAVLGLLVAYVLFAVWAHFDSKRWLLAARDVSRDGPMSTRAASLTTHEATTENAEGAERIRDRALGAPRWRLPGAAP